MSYALKFISGKYQGGEFPLRADREIIIGRASELDMVLVEDMVSRKHAKIVTADNAVVIQDLGSTNGTFVNGEKIKKARLKEGDRILIGTSILKLMQKAGDGIDEAQAKDLMAQAAAQEKQDSSMSGQIEDVPVPDLLQLFHTSRRSGVLEIQSHGRVGQIFLRNGDIYYASIDGDHEMGPIKSFMRILAWEEGPFELKPPTDEEFMIELEEPTEALLMDSLRQMDELRRCREDLPGLDEEVELESPIGAPLRDLSPEELDVLQLVHNHETHQDVLDHSDLTDLDTSQVLLKLTQKGYMAV